MKIKLLTDEEIKEAYYKWSDDEPESLKNIAQASVVNVLRQIHRKLTLIQGSSESKPDFASRVGRYMVDLEADLKELEAEK